MKKKYVKPEIYYEVFDLSTHVATCSLDMSNFKKIEECSASMDDYGMDGNFFNNNANCTDGPLDDYCYTNGGNNFNIFNS